MNIVQEFHNTGVVPVVVIENAKDAVPAAKALLAGGVNVMEITFRTAAAAESIEAVAKECPEMIVGAGTVLTTEQVDRAMAADFSWDVSAKKYQEMYDWLIG